MGNQSDSTVKLGHGLLRGLLPPRGNLEDFVFLKAKRLSSYLQYVVYLAVRAFGCYSMSNTLPLTFYKKNNNKIIKLRLLKWYLNYSNCLNSHVICNNS